jgi:hypothetical protein
LKQVLLGLSIGVEAVQLMACDAKLGLMLEKKLVDIIKQSSEVPV